MDVALQARDRHLRRAGQGEADDGTGHLYIGLRGGKIVVERDYWDCATLLRQLGALK